MRERGTILAIEDGAVRVDIEMHEGCASCAGAEACRSGMYSVRADAAGLEGIGVGKTVEIEVPSRTQAAGALWTVVLPLGALVAGYLAGLAVAPGTGEPAGVAGGVAGLVLGLAAGALANRRGRLAALPKVVAVVEAGLPPPYVPEDEGR